MPSLYMGPEVFRFQEIVIDRIVSPGVSGNYVLGDKDEAGEFTPMFVGRSDTDLNSELKSKLSSGFPFFKVGFADPTYAFQLESVQFHAFKSQLQNRAHPEPPEGTSLRCFVCGYQKNEG